jgi:hypothetical protein
MSVGRSVGETEGGAFGRKEFRNLLSDPSRNLRDHISRMPSGKPKSLRHVREGLVSGKFRRLLWDAWDIRIAESHPNRRMFWKYSTTLADS